VWVFFVLLALSLAGAVAYAPPAVATVTPKPCGGTLGPFRPTAPATAEAGLERARGVRRTERVSVGPARAEASGPSGSPVVTADGRFVAFYSLAPNLVEGDTNGRFDVFLHDRATGTTERLSVTADGAEGNGPSFMPTISRSGRYVAFRSNATNLVEGDTNGVTDAFVLDRSTRELERVSLGSRGEQPNADVLTADVSGDGRYVAFLTRASNLVRGDTNRRLDVFVHTRATGRTVRPRLSNLGRQPNGDSRSSGISANGRYLAVSSNATNLVAGDTNGKIDVFLFDRWRRATELVSVNSAERKANGRSFRPFMSAFGGVVAFRSLATNLVPGDTNRQTDVFVRDRVAGRTERVSVNSRGLQANHRPYRPVLSGNGRFVVFASSATNLVLNDTNNVTDIFLHDRRTDRTRRVSVSRTGGQANGCSIRPRISANGRVVVFSSAASNLVPRDRNRERDVFARVRF
jgi:Tol biopolymer transport system component